VIDIAPLTGVLEKTPGVTLAVLFGSAARDASGPGSDVDVGVLFADGAARHEEATALGVALERACGRTVDLVILNGAPPLLRFEIARGSVLLVEHTPCAWSDFRARAMLDWWDWAPIARRMYAAAAARTRRLAGTPAADASSPGEAPTRLPLHADEGRDGPA
jgi:uncharacterized protein